MNAKNTPTTSYDPEKLIDFFNKDVPPESMAKIIRNLNYVIALTLIRRNETLEPHKRIRPRVILVKSTSRNSKPTSYY